MAAEDARVLRAALIELEGTLPDTAPDLALAANRVRGEMGLPDLALQRIAQFVGKRTDVLVQRALTDALHGRVDDAVLPPSGASLERHYREVNGTRSLVFDGVPVALVARHAAGCACVLVERGYNEGEPVRNLAGFAGVGGIFPGLLEAAQRVIQSRRR